MWVASVNPPKSGDSVNDRVITPAYKTILQYTSPSPQKKRRRKKEKKKVYILSSANSLIFQSELILRTLYCEAP